MANLKNRPAIKGTAPSEEEQFYIEWGRETLKSNITLTNEILRQLVTLDATLLGGSIAFLDDKLMDPIFKKFIILFLLISLVFSFIGMMPYGRFIDLRQPYEIKEHKEGAFTWKRWFLWIAGTLLSAGFTTAFIGLIMHKP